MGLFSLGCEGTQGHRAKTLHSAPHWAHFSFSISCLRLKVMMHEELGCALMLEEGTHHPKGTPDHENDPQEGHSWVCWWPLPTVTSIPVCAHALGCLSIPWDVHSPAWLLASVLAFPRPLGEK